MGFATEFSFTLPRGYIDAEGRVHREGAMRLSTAVDEIAPLRDVRVRNNRAYFAILLLSRVVTRLGMLEQITPATIERLFSVDITYLQDFYRQVNETGSTIVDTPCRHCGERVAIDIGARSAWRYCKGGSSR